ncbi:MULTISPECIES: arsenite methyltransferase [Paenibacillus]|uniref:arsenite methyltransferase n=1 Tax=Paenibacillus TaxID=44249 RepID=UPI000957331A|nr:MULTISPECIES: arsenite methyltransferase [Paenibacillus]ASS68147.1 arsenite methyltransferase [Paenibacillus sp. RUD330]MEC0246347.1 arsenite methyltransferase [Paenibacillus chitinolyticus]SIR69140.1 Methyltransferase domain-containing protein [Paenibacillus sp. RU4X]SIR76481.1 Methyltransferase domain-containing protein [Paenibacillus sp. RU4T]
MNQVSNDQIRQNVRNRYKEIALQDVGAGSCCTPAPANDCCGSAADVSAKMGYSSEELTAVPDGANLGLGCGNPQAIAALQPGEVVLDLGSGGGFDCFLASRQVGASGRVIGVDMTPEMISRARENANKSGFTNTEFRLGEIEHLPVQDHSVDVIISNCVINLSPSKQQVFDEAFRVLRNGGRLAISDVVATADFPDEIKQDIDRIYSGCISGAPSIGELKAMLAQSGFTHIEIEPKDESRTFIKDWIPGANVEQYLVSAAIRAIKP